jgi:hypothetical protein
MGQATAVRDPERYDELRKQGYSKAKAARAANTTRAPSARRAALAPDYTRWSKRRLYAKAKEMGLDGRSTMSKAQLIRALRFH